MRLGTALSPFLFLPIGIFGDGTAQIAALIACSTLASILWVERILDQKTYRRATGVVATSAELTRAAVGYAENAEERHRVVAQFASAVSTAAANAAKELAPYDQEAARRSLNELRDALAYLEEHYPEVST